MPSNSAWCVASACSAASWWPPLFTLNVPSKGYRAHPAFGLQDTTLFEDDDLFTVPDVDDGRQPAVARDEASPFNAKALLGRHYLSDDFGVRPTCFLHLGASSRSSRLSSSQQMSVCS